MTAHPTHQLVAEIFSSHRWTDAAGLKRLGLFHPSRRPCQARWQTAVVGFGVDVAYGARTKGRALLGEKGLGRRQL